MIRLEALYETEYGMPSTHTVAGAVVPSALLLFSMQLYEVAYIHVTFSCIIFYSLNIFILATVRVGHV